MKYKHLIVFSVTMFITWSLGVYYWPHLVNDMYKKAIIRKGFSDGPVPINTLYVEPQALFADPLHTPLPPGSSKLMAVGVNHDTLLVVGWLDLSRGPLALHVPNFTDRYYSVQFTDPFDTDFAYVGTRTTGTRAGDYIVVGPDWKRPLELPPSTARIASPVNSVLVLGRILVYNDRDLPNAYRLAKQIQLTPLK